MTQANLSETLFKPRFKHPETSTLVAALITAHNRLCSRLLMVKPSLTGIA